VTVLDRTPHLSTRSAAFIGVGAMVGAGIFALQGYSFATFGARYPSAGGLLEYVVRGFGNGHRTGVIAWLLLATNAIITAMVAVSFGSYASGAFADGGATWTKVFAVLVVLVMTLLNVLGSQAVARAQTVVVVVVVGIRTVFAVATLSNLDTSLLAFSGYPSLVLHGRRSDHRAGRAERAELGAGEDGRPRLRGAALTVALTGR
jgi:amino acid transporter